MSVLVPSSILRITRRIIKGTTINITIFIDLSNMALFDLIHSLNTLMNDLVNLPVEKNSNSTDLSITKYIMMEMRSVYKPLMLKFSSNPFVMIASEL